MVEQDGTRHRVSGALQKATKETSSVIRLPRERLGEAAGLLARYFRANPNFVNHFQEERARAHALPHMFARRRHQRVRAWTRWFRLALGAGDGGDSTAGWRIPVQTEVSP
jgi:hypothetical protein